MTSLGTGTLIYIQQLVDEQVVRSPNSIALICDGVSLTYRELNERADRLARRLCGLGVKSETMVGICTARSLDMVVAMFAIFKAGGAYVPLDPSYPKERLTFILNDTQMPVVVTQAAYLSLFSERSIHVVALDEDWQEPTPAFPVSADTNITPETLAYVIYTSGSTGNPKGVMISHASLSHFVRLAGSALDVRSDDIYLQTASMSYALSVRQLMVPLANGATVVLANAEQMRDPLLMFQLIKREKITLIDFVPSFWRACVQRLAELPDIERKHLLDNSLRRIVSVGEPLLFDLPHDWFYKLGHTAQLVNIFGQTETTGVVATYPIPHEVPAETRIVPVGHSIIDTQLYILDADLRRVSAGEPGELYVSNPCLARGYLNRPELTAEKFIPNPFHDGLNSRLYRTGDMALQREDGNIEFLGRGDHQVKIRGQRVELGEIESILRRHGSVRECVVTPRGDHPDNKYLVAYIVAKDTSASSAELRAFVRNYLPEVMVPSAFVFLEALPLMPNGKLNRLALPDPYAIDASNPDSHLKEQSLSPAEQTLASIWMDLMNLGSVGINDNFFDLGGHSLSVVQLFSRLEGEFGVRLPLTTILQAPTIAKLAEILQKEPPSTDHPVLIPIRTQGDRSPFYCIHGIGGGVLGYRDLVNQLDNEHPVYGLQSIALEDPETSDGSIESMATRYISAIRSIQPKGPYRIGGYCFGGVVAYEMARQLEREGEKVSLLAILEGYVPYARNIQASSLERLPIFVKHIPAWIKDYASMSPGEVFSRVRSTWNRIRAKIQGRQDLQQRVRVEEILEMDLSKVPDRSVELTQAHSRAFHQYKPGTYGGTVTLFRARHRSLNEVVFGSLDQTMGWDGLAQGGVEVRMVDGFHRNIHLPPYLHSLASELNQCLKIECTEEKHHEL